MKPYGDNSSPENAYSGPVDVLPVEHDLYELTKNEPALPDPSQEEDILQDIDVDQVAAALLAVIVADTKTAAAWLRSQHENGANNWVRLCLMLQRTARHIPPLAPSAFVSAQQTPFKYRVFKRDNYKRGMVGYSWNPDNPGAGHIFFILGRSVEGKILVWTNDARQKGHVDIVDIDFFHREWGHKIQFCATWLNGFEFPDFHEEPKLDPVRLGGHFREARKELKRALIYGEEHHEFDNHPKIKERLERQLDRMTRLNSALEATFKKS